MLNWELEEKEFELICRIVLALNGEMEQAFRNKYGNEKIDELKALANEVVSKAENK